MKNKTLILLFLFPALCQAQAIVNSWIRNTTGKTASYWENTAANGSPPSYVYHTTTDSADVLKVCYNTDSVWVSSDGMTNDMGKYLNPGTCIAQNYVFRFPRTPTVPTTKTISPKLGAIGALINGIPVFGLSNAKSWSAATSTNAMGQGGDGIWNVEVYLSEGLVIDTAFGAHPQQQGAYHSHATPKRLYENSPSSQHSPLVGFAFDGYPIYGPYGYTDPTNTASGISRMKSGYGLRNISVRESVPYGAALTAAQYGPAVSSTYPLGTYCEDYEWLASNGGDLDEYNGRFCKTPDYPNGTYAYFVTIDAAGTAEFPYYIGIQYYGAPDKRNFPAAGQNASTLKFPSSGTDCLAMASIDEVKLDDMFTLYPNPTSADLTISRSDDWNHSYSLTIVNTVGATVYQADLSASETLHLSETLTRGIYLVRINSLDKVVVKRIVLQ